MDPSTVSGVGLMDAWSWLAGLETDAHGRVLDKTDTPIAGLYAVGNDMASIMGGNYPSGGITLGPAMTFGYIIGCRLAGQSEG